MKSVTHPMEMARETIPWREGWLINPLSGTPCRPGFRLAQTRGELAPNISGIAWELSIGSMPEAGCLAHGIVLADIGTNKFHHVISPAPATLCGETDGTAEVALRAKRCEVRHDGNLTTINDGGVCAILIIQRDVARTRWALVWSAGNEHETLVHAKAALAVSAKEEWEKLIAARRSIWQLAVCEDVLRPSVLESVEWLLGSLRPPDGAFPGMWMDTRGDSPAMDIGRSLAVLPALARIAPDTARQVLATIFNLEEPDHSLPAIVAPDLTPGQRFAPHPMLAAATLALWRQQGNLQFARDAVPRLVRFLQWQIDHFESRGNSICRWRHPAEALLPEVFDDELATPDLSALLLFEIDAVSELAAPFPDIAGQIEPLLVRRDAIEKALSGFFWDPTDREFRSRYLDGRAIARRTCSAAIPLLSAKLTVEQVAEVSKCVTPGGPLRKSYGIADWVRWDSDEAAAPASPLVQILLLRALRRRDLVNSADTLAAELASQIASAHKELGRLPATLSDPPAAGGNPLETAALVIHLIFGDELGSRKPRRRVSPTLDWLDKQRHGIAIAAMIAAIGISAIFALPEIVKSGAGIAPETKLGDAQLKYVQGEFREAIRIYEELLDTPLRDSQAVDFHLGNSWFNLGGFPQAEAAYRTGLNRNPDQPRAWMNLALSLFKQRKFEEAAKIYSDFLSKFSNYYPELAARAKIALELCDEQRAKQTRQ